MSELPHSVRIREVGPRDGFQNEPETIPTHEKVRLIDQLGRQARDNEFGLRREIIQNAQVVLCTHGGTSSMLSRHKFDLVVMDEASQATEPLSWIPITLGKKVVFAGDSHQLPPTIYSRVAAERGLKTTIFDRMKKILPE